MSKIKRDSPKGLRAVTVIVRDEVDDEEEDEDYGKKDNNEDDEEKRMKKMTMNRTTAIRSESSS